MQIYNLSVFIKKYNTPRKIKTITDSITQPVVKLLITCVSLGTTTKIVIGIKLFRLIRP